MIFDYLSYFSRRSLRPGRRWVGGKQDGHQEQIQQRRPADHPLVLDDGIDPLLE